MFNAKRVSLLALVGLIPLAAVASEDSYLKVQSINTGPQTDAGPAPAACPTGTENSFSTGSGATQFRYCVSGNGAIQAIDIGGIREAFGEGYAVCSDQTATVYAVAGPVNDTFHLWNQVVTQPGGPNTLPLTVSFSTLDGRLLVTQKFAHVLSQQMITLTTTLKNTSGVLITGLKISRAVDADIGATVKDSFAATARTAFAWDEADRKLELTGTTTLYGAKASFDSYFNFSFGGNSLIANCLDGTQAAPNLSEDGAMKVVYTLGSLNPNASRSVSFVYQGK